MALMDGSDSFLMVNLQQCTRVEVRKMAMTAQVCNLTTFYYYLFLSCKFLPTSFNNSLSVIFALFHFIFLLFFLFNTNVLTFLIQSMPLILILGKGRSSSDALSSEGKNYSHTHVNNIITD